MAPRTGSNLSEQGRGRGQARRWLHLPVEGKARELEARILLASVAAERGYGVVLGRKGDVAKIADRIPRGVYLEKSAQLFSLHSVKTRRALGHVECCQDEEGVVYTNAEDYTNGRLGRPVLDCFHRFFCWGDEQAEIVGGWHPPVADRLRVTGNPRVDLWRPELRALYDDSAAELCDRFGPFVLVTTAFAMVNNSRGEHYFRETLRSNGRFDDAGGEAFVEGYFTHSRKLFDGLLEAVDAVARARPEQMMVVRPHPSEDITRWEEATAELSNVTVCREGAVTPWLLAADAVVHNNSTTGLEAALLGRPTIAYTPITDTRYDQNLPNPVSQSAVSTDDLTGLLDEVASTGNMAAQPARFAFLDRHIASLEGPLAADRMMDVIEEIDVPESRLDGGFSRRVSAKVRLTVPRLASYAGRVDRPPVGPKAATPDEPKAVAFPPTPASEVVSFIDRLRAVTGRFDNVECRELDDRIYVVEPTDP